MEALHSPPVTVPLRRATCEVSATRPAMFLGLPRKLSSLLIFLCTIVIMELEQPTQWAGAIVITAMTWFVVKEQVSRDVWGFDNWLAWLTTTFRFWDQGGKEGWGGARLCALPLKPASPIGASRRAPR